MPLLSIIIPVYNVEKYISTCLLSVLENDLEPIDYEIIVVDDESPDNSMTLVNELAVRFSNIRIVSQKNTGISGARNTGIRHAKGNYILFIDSDDWILKESLGKLAALCKEQDLDILEFGIEKRNNDGSVVGSFSASTSGEIYTGVEYYKKCRYVNSVFNKVYKRELLIENDLLFTEKIYVEDFELNTRAFLAANRVSAIPDLIYQYRQSPDSITRTKDVSKRKKMIEDHVVVLQKTHQLFQTEKREENRSFLEERMSFLVVSIFYLMLKNNFSYAEMKNMRTRLRENDLYRIEFPVHQKNKNVFRKLLLKSFSLLALLKNVSKNLTSR